MHGQSPLNHTIDRWVREDGPFLNRARGESGRDWCGASLITLLLYLHRLVGQFDTFEHQFVDALFGMVPGKL